MESLTSRKAADLLGVNAQKFHRLVAAYDVHPVFEADGIRGVKLWNPRDIESLGQRIADAERAAVAAEA